MLEPAVSIDNLRINKKLRALTPLSPHVNTMVIDNNNDFSIEMPEANFLGQVMKHESVYLP